MKINKLWLCLLGVVLVVVVVGNSNACSFDGGSSWSSSNSSNSSGSVWDASNFISYVDSSNNYYESSSDYSWSEESSSWESSWAEESSAETYDPYAYAIRDWASYMQMPTQAQIDSVRGLGRSPYIAIYPYYSGLERAIEYCVDFHIDHDPYGTYVCPLNWWDDVSDLEARYAKVYNDFTGTPGGYCGFQQWEDGSKVFIMSVWCTFCEDYSGNVTVYRPEVVYPEGEGKANVGNAEGSFTQYITPFDWHVGRDYRVLLQHTTSPDTGNALQTVYICDLLTNEWYLMASFDLGVPDLHLGSAGGFLENYLIQYTGEVRTAEFFNLRARDAYSGEWISCDNVKFLLNGSVTDLGYTGSAAFGTDGSSIWAITSGVSGLCQAPDDTIWYPLAPGDTTDPY